MVKNTPGATLYIYTAGSHMSSSSCGSLSGLPNGRIIDFELAELRKPPFQDTHYLWVRGLLPTAGFEAKLALGYIMAVPIIGVSRWPLSLCRPRPVRTWSAFRLHSSVRSHFSGLPEIEELGELWRRHTYPHSPGCATSAARFGAGPGRPLASRRPGLRSSPLMKAASPNGRPVVSAALRAALASGVSPSERKAARSGR